MAGPCRVPCASLGAGACEYLHEGDEAVLTEAAGLAGAARHRGQQQILLRPRVWVALRQHITRHGLGVPSLSTQEHPGLTTVSAESRF